jgi:predicted O-methyltransferase YrrM
MLPDPEFIATIKGFLDGTEGRRLYDLALAAAPRGPCLEIGSYCGKSAVYLGAACRRSGGILFSIDHHRGSEEQQPGEAYFDSELFDAAAGVVDTFAAFRRTLALAGLEETVIPIVCRSETAARCWTTPLSLVFIDGGHALETVGADYRCWAPRLMTGGFLLFHDIFPDPHQGGQAPYRVYRQALESGHYEELPMTNSLGVLRRRGK